MSTQIAEAPPVTKSTAAQPLPSAKQAGLTSMADAFQNLVKSPPASSEPPSAVEQPIAETKPAEAKPALLDSLSDTVGKQPENKKVELSEKASKAFSEIKGERDQFRTEAETLKKQLEEAQTWKKELDAIKPKAEKADEYAKRLHEVAFEKTDAYRELVDGQAEILTTAKQLAKDYEQEEGVIDQALALKGKKRIDFLVDTFGPSGAKFDSMLDQYELAEGRKQSEIRRSREQSEKMTQAERELALSEENRQRQAILDTFDASIPRFATKLPGYFAKNGDAEHNTMVDEVIATGRKIAESTDPDVQAEALALAAVAPSAIRRLAKAETENAALRKRVQELSANNPGLPTGSEVETDGGGKPHGMMEALRSRR